MENQINAGEQNIPQVGQNPTIQPVVTPKTNCLMIGGVALVCSLIFGFSGYYLGKQSSNSQYANSGVQANPTATPYLSNPTPTTNPSSTSDPTVNWKTYTDSAHGFSVKYPNNWTVLPGGGAFPWININSPDVGPKGSQDAHIGMSASIQVFNAVKQIENADLKQLVSDEGILKHAKVNIVTESFATIQNHQIFKYEYEGNEQGYLFHYWGMNIANDKNIISLLITDFKEDKSLNTQELATQILSTFKFIK